MKNPTGAIGGAVGGGLGTALGATGIESLGGVATPVVSAPGAPALPTLPPAETPLQWAYYEYLLRHAKTVHYNIVRYSDLYPTMLSEGKTIDELFSEGKIARDVYGNQMGWWLHYYATPKAFEGFTIEDAFKEYEQNYYFDIARAYQQELDKFHD